MHISAANNSALQSTRPRATGSRELMPLNDNKQQSAKSRELTTDKVSLGGNVEYISRVQVQKDQNNSQSAMYERRPKQLEQAVASYQDTQQLGAAREQGSAQLAGIDFYA